MLMSTLGRVGWEKAKCFRICSPFGRARWNPELLDSGWLTLKQKDDINRIPKIRQNLLFSKCGSWLYSGIVENILRKIRFWKKRDDSIQDINKTIQGFEELNRDICTCNRNKFEMLS